MDNKKLEKEILGSLDVIKQAVDNLYETNYETIADIRSRLEYLNLIIVKNNKEYIEAIEVATIHLPEHVSAGSSECRTSSELTQDSCRIW